MSMMPPSGLGHTSCKAYSPECVEGKFCELRHDAVLRSSLVEKLEPTVADAAERLTPPSQGRQDLLGAAVLALREPLAQLRDDRPRHTVALEPSKQLLLAGGELHPLQVPTHLGGQALPQEIHATSPPPLLGRLAG